MSELTLKGDFFDQVASVLVQERAEISRIARVRLIKESSEVRMRQTRISTFLAEIVDVVGDEREYVVDLPARESVDIRLNDDRVSNAIDLPVERRNLSEGSVGGAGLYVVAG